MENTPFL
jgi:hypothetical protein